GRRRRQDVRAGARARAHPQRPRIARPDRAGDRADRVRYLRRVRVVRQRDRQGQAPGIPSGDLVRGVQAARGATLTGPVAASQQGQSDTPARPAAGQPRRRVGVLVSVALFVLALDIATKITVVKTLSDGRVIPLLGGFLHLRLERNAGAAFSFGTGLTV